MITSRRAFLGLAGAAALGACRRGPVNPRALRLGYFPNITHGPAIVGAASGHIAAALPGVRVTTTLFSAGPAAMSALLADAIDACFTGPIPAASAFMRSHGRALRCVAGACSGGAVLVARPRLGLRGAGDLRGRRVATPQLGNTQDVALRHYLRANGMDDTTRGGDVTVVNLESPNILSLFRQGSLDAAWVPEPWGARLLAAGGTLALDERDLWPGRAFATTLLVAQRRYIDGAGAVVDALVDATAREVRRMNALPDRGLVEVGAALGALTSSRLPPGVLRDAFSRITFTPDPLPATVRAMVRHGQDLGMFPLGELDGFFDEARVARARAAV